MNIEKLEVAKYLFSMLIKSMSKASERPGAEKFVPFIFSPFEARLSFTQKYVL